jgi:molybdopterin-binding protein
MRQAAELLGVSDDTVRRWADAGRLATTVDEGGRRAVEGEVLARFAQSLSTEYEAGVIVSESARNRFAGIITRVVKDKVMAQVEMQSGRHRLVSLMTREAADELGLAPGVLAVAAVKATNVVVNVPAQT